MSAFSSTKEFYDLDPRRQRSPEVDYGVWWKWHDDNYRISWVETTGELVAVRLGHGPRLRAMGFATHLPARVALAGEPMEVYVLCEIPELDDVERTLEGWADVCGQPDSLGWVCDRVDAYLERPTPAPAPPSLSPRRRRPWPRNMLEPR